MTPDRLGSFVAVHDVSSALEVLHDAVVVRMRKHGNAPYASRHAALGVLTEEFWETVEAIRLDGAPQRFSSEMLDVAVTALWWIAGEVARQRARVGGAR